MPPPTIYAGTHGVAISTGQRGDLHQLLRRSGRLRRGGGVCHRHWWLGCKHHGLRGHQPGLGRLHQRRAELHQLHHRLGGGDIVTFGVYAIGTGALNANTTVYVATRGGLSISTDGGQNYTKLHHQQRTR